MTDEAALLAAVLDRPEDDTPRLVFADYCDDHGQGERAAFIRVQVEEARLTCPFCRSDHPCSAGGACVKRTLFKRERALLAKVRDSLRAELPPSTPPWAFYLSRQGAEFDDGWTFGMSRGFADRLTCPAADWLAFADAITAAHPVRAVRLTSWPTDGIEVFWVSRDRQTATCDRWPGITFTLPPAEPNPVADWIEDDIRRSLVPEVVDAMYPPR